MAARAGAGDHYQRPVAVLGDRALLARKREALDDASGRPSTMHRRHRSASRTSTVTIGRFPLGPPPPAASLGSQPTIGRTLVGRNASQARSPADGSR
jgi:hypothetical protein